VQWATAAALGAAAAFWIEPGLWRVLAGAAAVAVLLLPRLPGPAAVGLSARRTRWLVLLAIAASAQATAPDLWAFATSPWVRVWNVYHYYLGSKYFAELGYADLYVASLAADGAGYWRGIDRIRDLETHEVVPRAAALADYRPEEHFTAERWAAFRRDVAALQPQRPPDRWDGIFRDRGYNPPPLWTAVGGLLARLPADRPWALKLLCALDLALLAATFLLIRRTFGARSAALVLLLFALNPVNDGRLVGNFLGYDWFAALASGFCLLRRGRTVPAAGLLAYAAGTRIFPAIFLAAAGLAAAATAWRTRSVAKRDLRFAAALAALGLAAFALGALGARGAGTGRSGWGAWGDFAGEISRHNAEHRFGEQRIGLAHVFTRDVRTLDFDDPGRRERRELAARQRPLFVAAGTVLLLGFAFAAVRRSPFDAFLLGLVPFFVLAVSSRYYWAVLALLPLLARPGPGAGLRTRRLAAAQAGLFAVLGVAALRGLSGFGFYSLFELLLAGLLAALVGGFLLHDLAVRRRRTPARAWYRSRALAGAFFVVLFVLLTWLRAPHPDLPIRDVDESVSALIAASWLEGGVPYRDAIDQRGPVTYLIYAAVFAATSVYDMAAVHWALLLLILASCFVVFRLGRRLRPGAAGAAVGYLAALLVAVSSFTYRRSQMLAFHTEWPLLLFAALAMLLVWRGLAHGRRRDLVAAGACFAVGFLAKQPGLFDAGAAALFVLLWQHRRGTLWSADTLRKAAGLAAGFFAVVGLAVAYFAARGALGDFVFYFWTYNVEHYTAIVPWSERLDAIDPFNHGRHYLTANPLLLLGSAVSIAAAAAGWFRHRRTDGRLLLALWFLFGYFGASYSGRNFGHYFIQIIAPACLLAAWAGVDAWRALAPRRERWRGRADLAVAGRAALVAALVLGLAIPLVRFSGEIAGRTLWTERTAPPARVRLLAAIRERTAPGDSIFVWGYYPELYVLAPRRPASRYSNTNYLTGMLPWENHLPGIDTSAHVVPGAWDVLMAELEASRPPLIVDTAVGDHRSYAKYPIASFPRLQDFLDRHYARVTVVDDGRGRPVAALWLLRS
jgi:hypothetical protein